MLIHPKIGFHGACDGVGDYLGRLTAAKIPSVFKAVNDGGWAEQVAKMVELTGVPHTIIFRQTNPGGAGDDHLDLTKNPHIAATRLWSNCLLTMPPEVARYKRFIHIEPTNEPGLMRPDENGWKERQEWMNEALTYLGELMLQDDFMPALAGFNAGTPDPAAWPIYRSMLNLLADYNGLLTWHEAKLPGNWSNGQDHHAPIELFVPHVMCSASKHMAAWEQMGLSRFPNTVISESAWGYRELPADGRVYVDIDYMAHNDAQYREWLQGRLLWTCTRGAQWGDLRNQLTKHVEWVTEYVLDGVEADDMADCIGKPREDYKRTFFVAPPGITKAQYMELAGIAYDQNRATVGGSYDDAGIGDLPDKTAVLYGIPPERKQEFKEWYAVHYPGTKLEFRDVPWVEPPPNPGNPLTGLKLGRIFNEPYVLTSPFDAPRTYNGKPAKHEGADYDILINEVDSKRPVLAIYPGEVVRAQSTTSAGALSAYGWHIRVKCQNNGSVFYYWLCHMDKLYVAVGDVLEMGKPVGELGGSGASGAGSFAEHCHVNLEVPGYGLGGYVVSDVVDPAPYIPVYSGGGSDYTGPPVTAFVSGLDAPGDDWRWPQVDKVFQQTGLYPKFHTSGNSYQWYLAAKHPTFNLVRVMLSSGFSSPYAIDFYMATVRDMRTFYDQGVRDFVVLNEPNIEHQGSWDNGYQFGRLFNELCHLYKSQMKDIRLWFPGCSPQFGAQHQFITDAQRGGAFVEIHGIVEHVYTGIVDDEEAAVAQILGEVLDFRQRYALTRPLCIGEFSVNRPAPPDYKARVYNRIYDKLQYIKGLQAAYCFTVDWEAMMDVNKEGWARNGIDAEWIKLNK